MNSAPTIYYHYGDIENARKLISTVSPQSRVAGREEVEANPEIRSDVDVLVAWPNIDVSQWPNASWLQVWSAGVNPDLLQEKRVQSGELVVTNTSGIHAEPIAEQAFAMMLMFARRMHLSVPPRCWAAREHQRGATVIAGKTLGIVGLGAIGRRIGELARAFGMRVVATRRRPVPEAGYEWVGGPDDLERLLGESDYVFNVLPLTEQTRGVIDAKMFAAMKPTAFYLNYGRGGTNDTDALVEALRCGTIAGAGLDALDPEPLPDEHPLWKLPNAIITPHYGGAFEEYHSAAFEILKENVTRFRLGRPLLNVVDPQLGY